MKAQEKLLNAVEEKKFICVGLDTDLAKIPEVLKSSAEPVLEFNRQIIEATKNEAGAYKLNFAFYEKLGSKGLEILKKTVDAIPENILVIGDAKRGDIGNTSKMYAASVFDHFKFDAVTLNPYMGIDSIQPFLDYEDKISFILALTSNPSSADFEKLKLQSGEYLFQSVIKKAAEWNKHKNVGVVFGATNTQELESNAELLKGLSILLPGVGAQGGSVQEVVSILQKVNKNDFLINVSRGIIYKDNCENFASAALKELESYNQQIKSAIEKWKK